jgi:hypothetical protein
MNSGGCLVLVAMCLCACSRSGDKAETPAARGSSVLASAPTPASTARPASSAKSAHAPKPGAKTSSGAKPAAAPSAHPAVDAGKEEPKSIVEEELKTEEPEANPYSESVTLKLSVVTRANALVLWGAKQMAHLEPGKMETEITRPRGSGPLDLEIKAEGFMPYHTRLYADRNDKLSVRLYRAEEAPGIFGYKRSAEARKAEAEAERAQRK